MDQEYPDDVMRSAQAIARRSVVLSSIVAVAYGASRRDTMEWLRRESLLTEVSPREQAFLAATDPSKKEVIAFTWMVERLVPLLWSIKKISTMPLLTCQCNTEQIARAIVWPPAESLTFVQSAELRAEGEIHEEYEKIYEAHWKVRDAQLRKKPIPDELVGGAIYERHYGFNWVIGYFGQEWDDISTDT